MKPTEVLVREHEYILKVVAALYGAAKRLQSGEDLPAEFFHQAVRFIREYADARHHGKEEALLFPALEAKGMPNEGGPIGVMLTEHVIGRQNVAEMDAAAKRYEQGDEGARGQLAAASMDYARLLMAHIDKENNILFMMANQFLEESDQGKLKEQFDEVDARREFADTQEAYEQWAVEVGKQYGAEVEV